MAIKPSARLAATLLFSHAIAVFVVYLTAIPWTARLVAGLLIMSSLTWHLSRDALLIFPDSWREISLVQNGATVVARDGSRLFGRITGRTVVSPYFVLLRIRPEGQGRTVSRVIFPDAMDADAFRELRVHLKFAAP